MMLLLRRPIHRLLHGHRRAVLSTTSIHYNDARRQARVLLASCIRGEGLLLLSQLGLLRRTGTVHGRSVDGAHHPRASLLRWRIARLRRALTTVHGGSLLLARIGRGAHRRRLHRLRWSPAGHLRWSDCRGAGLIRRGSDELRRGRHLLD